MTKTFDLLIIVAPKKEAKTLSGIERDALFKRPTVEEKKNKTAGFIPRAQLEDQKEKPLELSLEDISTGYTELIAKADGLLNLLSERVGDMTYEFSPQEKPVLSEAVSETFNGEHQRITYQMYLQCLKLDKDLAVAIGEQSHGLR
jgi:hypothetical protein